MTLCIDCNNKKLTNRNYKRCKSCSMIFRMKSKSARDKISNKMKIICIGRKHTEVSRLKISQNRKAQKCGDTHWNWKGGVTKIGDSCRGMPEYKQWRSDVFTRDNWTCQTCNIRGVYLEAHHIISLSKIINDFNIKNILDARDCNLLWDISNGVTLCLECHMLTDNYKGKAIKK